MNQGSKTKKDWSKGRFREMLVWQRRNMWTDETIERLARWMNLRPGLTAVDIGCGLGYLGYTYWKYFGDGGHYIGVDIAGKLLGDAAETCKEWAIGGRADFIEGDAYHIPLPDNTADWVMSQVVMMHLEYPERVLAEMVRILKPGGLILCKEPDNLRPVLVGACSSLPEYDIETRLLVHKVLYTVNRGRKKMGRGDAGIAPKIPHMLTGLGIDEIEVRVKESASYLEPPYPTEVQKQTAANMKKYMLADDQFKAHTDEQKEEFLAGGGDIKDFGKFLVIGQEQRRVQLRQLEKNEFYICGAYPFYIIKGRKPRK